MQLMHAHTSLTRVLVFTSERHSPQLELESQECPTLIHINRTIHCELYMGNRIACRAAGELCTSAGARRTERRETARGARRTGFHDNRFHPSSSFAITQTVPDSYVCETREVPVISYPTRLDTCSTSLRRVRYRRMLCGRGRVFTRSLHQNRSLTSQTLRWVQADPKMGTPKIATDLKSPSTVSVHLLYEYLPVPKKL